ncbi:unnamed protein product [Moneuplotes crassus]|uniref:protein-histidine N-methyltransferase n=1 Tax=Euplotes crassus TaxID=5936 RepID=A0AAD1XJ87_EUPCR|nr:unnamed protein product [Moneuplotes crassus]
MLKIAHAANISTRTVKTESGNELELKYFDYKSTGFSPSETDLKKDCIVSGEYEGGLELWEGNVCLIKHLLDTQSQYSNSEDLRVLDVGCGQGQAGAILLSAGAQVTFQDFNKNVISDITPLCVNANLETWQSSSSNKKAHYIYGDWEELTKECSGEEIDRYDLILTADTVYNKSYYQKLYEYIRINLKESGTCLCSCQAYYYGCGGGEQEYIDFSDKFNEFDITKLQEFEDNNSIKRCVLGIKWKPESYTTSKEVPPPQEAETENFLSF